MAALDEREVGHNTAPDGGMKHLVEWDRVELRISGDKLQEVVRASLAGANPLERLSLSFANGLLRVDGSIRKVISIPFRIDIPEIGARGRTVRIPLATASTFIGLPIPQFLFRLLSLHVPKGIVAYEEPSSLLLSLDHFLPPFIHVEIHRVWIFEGGLAVVLGRGGADLPGPPGGSNGGVSSIAKL